MSDPLQKVMEERCRQDEKWGVQNHGDMVWATILGEGQVVRYYRHPKMDGQHSCEKCGNIMHLHGWIETLEGGHIVCPGDWIITGVEGERYPCKPGIFEQTYEPVSDRSAQSGNS